MPAWTTRLRTAASTISPKFLDLSREKFPDLTFYQADLLAGEADLPSFDYVVMNGVFTMKDEMSYGQMLDYWRTLTELAFEKADVGLAFNVMSTEVDWERDDLFHLTFADLIAFVARGEPSLPCSPRLRALRVHDLRISG